MRFDAVGFGWSVEQSFDHIMKEKVGLLMEGHHPRTNHPVHGNSVTPTFIVKSALNSLPKVHNGAWCMKAYEMLHRHREY